MSVSTKQIITPVVEFQAHEYNDLSDAQILYEDASVKITVLGITLKDYFFPFKQEKFVPMAHIMQVHVHKSFWTSCTWGLSDSTWWCKDDSRRIGTACVIIRTGGYLMKGFSPNAGDITTTKQEMEDLVFVLDEK